MKLKINAISNIKIILFMIFSFYSLQAQDFTDGVIKHIVWDESQSFQYGQYKIKLNCDGTNSVMMHSGGKLTNLDTAKIINKGCIYKREENEDQFIIEKFWDAEEGKKIFDSLISLGIQNLKSVEAIAVDGGEIDITLFSETNNYTSIINIPGYPENSKEFRILEKCRKLFDLGKIKIYFYRLFD